MSAADELLALGWKEYPDQFERHARCFYKRYPTPTRCSGNSEKEGMQVCIYLSETYGWKSIEMEVAGEMHDGTWIKMLHYVLPREVENAVKLIPRLLAAWEAAANCLETNN